MMRRGVHVKRFGLPLLMLLSVTACSRDPQPSAAAGAPSAAQPGPTATSESVAAVAQGGAAGPVDVRFVLEKRPVAGAASTLRLEFTAAAPLTGVTVRIEGETLGFDPAGSQTVIDLPEAGKPVSYTVGFTPQSPGIVEASVRVLPPGAGAREALYAIPVLVDAAAAAAAAE